MAARTCDGCGTRQPFGRRRTRQPDGRMLCDNCVAGRPGIPLTGSLEAAMTDPLRCQSCGQHSQAGLVRTGGLLRCADGCKPITPRWPKIAHDPGDPAIVAHCPGCGSGSVTRRSDGSVECEFCGNVYTIWAQPKFPAMPQTVDGQPVSIPGMPDREQAPQAGPDGFAPAGTQPNTGFAPAGGGPMAAPDVQPKRIAPVPGVPQAPPQVNPLAATGALYLTDDGVAIGEESYLARLALEVADDRGAVLAQVKASRKTAVSASSVSAALRRGGMLPVPRDWNHEGITVSGSMFDEVAVNAFILQPGLAKRMSETAEEILSDAGYTIRRQDDTMFYVSKS